MSDDIIVTFFKSRRVAKKDCPVCHGTGKRFFGRMFCKCVEKKYMIEYKILKTKIFDGKKVFEWIPCQKNIVEE